MTRAELRTRAREILERHWHPSGYTAPNARRYRWQWLWDSCFHALVWAELGEPERALAELRSVFRWQSPSGFVPHMGYQDEPDRAEDLWGRSGASSITQPPMYGHAIAELRRRGIDVPDELVERARAGLCWILDHRCRDGRLFVVHPWETGCDDTPTWDAHCTPTWDLMRWRLAKQDMVADLVLDGEHAAVGSTRFEVVNQGFEALVAFNAAELGIAWEPPACWVTDPDDVVVIDELFVTLAGRGTHLLETALDDRVFGGRYGPAGVRRNHPSFDPGAYWRGPAWPQLTYLLWVAARRCGRDDLADDLACRLRDGAAASGFSEYWHPDTGEALGATPQSWATLAVVVDAA